MRDIQSDRHTPTMTEEKRNIDKHTAIGGNRDKQTRILIDRQTYIQEKDTRGQRAKPETLT